MLRIFPYDTEGVDQAIADFEDEFTIKFPEKYKNFYLNIMVVIAYKLVLA
ncbi:hypothetical protein [Streptococcus cristatus]|nr:hypothetical protein [Streptococcus cristatus]